MDAASFPVILFRLQDKKNSVHTALPEPSGVPLYNTARHCAHSCVLHIKFGRVAAPIRVQIRQQGFPDHVAHRCDNVPAARQTRPKRHGRRPLDNKRNCGSRKKGPDSSHVPPTVFHLDAFTERTAHAVLLTRRRIGTATSDLNAVKRAMVALTVKTTIIHVTVNLLICLHFPSPPAHKDILSITAQPENMQCMGMLRKQLYSDSQNRQRR